MTSAQLLSLIIFLPALASIIVALLPKGRDDLVRGFTLLVTIVTMAIALLMAIPIGPLAKFDVSQAPCSMFRMFLGYSSFQYRILPRLRWN